MMLKGRKQEGYSKTQISRHFFLLVARIEATKLILVQRKWDADKPARLRKN